ncbi:NAD(P)/FAD-dependent oxidoreductase [Xylophilus sp.]|uniref:NAD(P)/FAD-dependent oxidoreductase n=1 Tax=Xylophilus sp. TaxID=2653893 RepID=UPI0013BBB1F9|nr:FAD-binding oxidoreductase [Xylophilus sp.]KAF1047831.1 MAG: 4-methylaminobutanoate oxidase (formaldehyde-forming) [Xylophilus sp.]
MTDKFRRQVLIGGGAAVAAAGAGLLAISSRDASLVPGKPHARRVQGDTELVDAVEVAVIGGGIVGTSTALSLAERGVSVALFEKGVIAGEASGRAHGLVESKHQAAIKQPLIELSKQRWRKLNELTGEDTGWRERDIIQYFETDEKVHEIEEWQEQVKGATAHLGRFAHDDDVARLLPGAATLFKGAFFVPGEGIAEPRLAAAAIARGGRRLGGKIYENTAVRGIEREGGRVSAVVTERGTVKARAVVLAGGVWSPVFARSLGLDLPQFTAYASIQSLAPQPGLPDIVATLPRVGVRREFDGGYTVGPMQGIAPILPSTVREGLRLLPAIRAQGSYIKARLSWSNFLRELNTPTQWPLDRPSPFEDIRILQPRVRDPLLDESLAYLRSVLPSFDQATVRERWAGSLMTTLDNAPVIAPVAQIPGLILGTGFYYGFTMGPGAGEVLADLATGRTPSIDLAPFRFERFSDGTQLGFHA